MRICHVMRPLLFVLGLWACAASSLAAGTTQPATSPSLEEQYTFLLSRAKDFNARCSDINPWIMDVEHCFLTRLKEGSPDLLRTEVIAFVRTPGAMDLLFDRLLGQGADDAEVLAIAEMLMFAGEHRETPDERIGRSYRAKAALDAANEGKFLATERRYPKAPIREKIINAARRAIEDAQIVETPTTQP
jgi:hypothetical protein